MKDRYIECVDKYQPDFFTHEPQTFANEKDGYASLCLNDMYGALYYEGKEDEKPIVFIRHANPDSYRFGGILELGDNYLMPQKGGYHFDKIAHKDTKVDEYQKISDDPLTYGFGSKEPFSEYRFYLDHATCNEGNVLDLYATPLPVCIVDHGCLFPPLVQFMQPCMVKGTFEGKPVHGLASVDRLYMPKSVKEKFGENMGYFCAMAIGLREDDRFEVCLATIDQGGTSVGLYWLEGQEPVISYEVTLEADWVRLPYVDDGTCIYENATYRFADIEFHVNGKWGTKGFTEKPRIERHGQSQVYGTWHVGRKPYKHKLSTTFFENMECYDYKLKEKGFKIID
jgi:hypothetical protein